MTNPDLSLKRIAIVICYIGELPWYFEYFLTSCRYNPTVDFYIISDKRYLKSLPRNISFIFKTIDELNQLASDKLGFLVNIKSGYKLCDFKPAYRVIFDDIIVNYDFWGYADLDIVFGNIREFITETILGEYDVISVRHDYLTGYFQLFRNTKGINSLFRESRDHQFVFQSDRHFCFDETNFKFDDFAAGKHWTEIPSEIESMMHVIKRLQEQKGLKAYFDFLVIEGTPGELRWSKGRLFYKEHFEVLLYHMIHFKSVYHRTRQRKIIPNEFFITEDDILH